MTCSPEPVPCQGEYEPETCDTNCGQFETIKTKNFIVSVQPSNGGTACPTMPPRQYTCPATDLCAADRCIGTYDEAVCPSTRGCGEPETTVKRPFKIHTNGSFCPEEGTTRDHICPSTAPCYTGSMNRPTTLYASQKFKNQNNRARLFKYKNGRPYCLMIGGDDNKFSPNDSVELRPCNVHNNDALEQRLSSWRIKNDGRIETYETTDRYKKNNVNQPLCLDYNNNSYKVTKCDPGPPPAPQRGRGGGGGGGGGGNLDLLNRTFTLNDHGKMTWSYHENQLTNSTEYSQWEHIAPVRIVPGRTSQCMDDASNDKVDNCDKEETAYYMTQYGATNIPNWEDTTTQTQNSYTTLQRRR